MTDIINLNLEQSYALYHLYQENYSSNEIPDLVVWDRKLSASEYFDELAFFALNEKTTLGIYYSFKSVFLEICSRWICQPEIETRYRERVNQFQIEGITVLSAFSRLLNISQEPLGIIEYYLLQRNFWDSLKTLKSNGREISCDELNSLLLAFYRLLSYDLDRFYKFVEPEFLYEISNIEEEEYYTSKYLSIMLLSYYLKASESSQTKILDARFGKDANLCGTYEGQTDINFKHLSLLEARRLSKFSCLPSRLDESDKVTVMKVFPQDLSPILTSVCGILVPNLITSGSRMTSRTSNFVASPSSIHVMKHLALCVQKNLPVMLFGESGSGKTYFVNKLAECMSYQNSLVKIHLNEQTDAKLLLGTYSTSGKLGNFSWKPGILTSAVTQGKWIFIEDIDKAPTEVLSVLLGLLEKRQLTISSRGETIEARNGFQLISTLTISGEALKERLPEIIGLRLWKLIHVTTPSDENLKDILSSRFPLLVKLIDPLIICLRLVNKVFSSSRFLTLNRGSHPRTISFKDLVKLCRRLSHMMEVEGVRSLDQMMDSSIYDSMFAETMDCFGSSISEEPALKILTEVIAQVLQVLSSSVHSVIEKSIPKMLELEDRVRIGRATLSKNKYMKSRNKIGQDQSFAKTIHALKLMEQIGVAVQMTEPVLLVGETGTGKTTVIQHLAKSLGKKMTAINLSQQTEAGDLLGSFKPINAKTIAVPLQEIFENLFSATFSSKKNERFSQVLSKCFNKSQWRNVIKLWREAIKMALDVLKREEGISNTDSGSKRRKTMVPSEMKKKPLDAWVEFEQNVNKFELESKSVENSFVFNFVEGSLVRAIKNGEWVLLDEINLASSDTLESIADLLTEAVEERTVLLTERGDTDPIKAHPEFRLFACMNPSTDIGKRDLPSGIRSRFTEIYVHSPEKNMQDLLSIINQYIGRYSMGDDLVSNDVANLYLEVRSLVNHNAIVDGANQKPHFSIRTLSRTLSYVDDVVSIYGLRRSLYEGFCMSFLTLLDEKSEEVLHPLIFKYTVARLGNFNSVLKQCPPPPSSSSGYDFVQFSHYWIKRGPQPVIHEPNYIITPFVEKNLLNLARATSGRRFPVLIQGPTSAGKTSMIRYLANATGHKFVRINNHEHTDLQEYLGTFVSDSSGKLVFREGLLVQALREGHWIVLDELNLAPTDILEALNRLLDDNRELFIPETQEVVRPHTDFMLFATQNPPGLYGGRKHLSRAFRNRFLELHFDEIPHEELERILTDRCSIAPSYSKKIVEVYNALSLQRQSTRIFEQKNSFATLRDLFRWALREAIGYEELAANGYMILGERVRKNDEKEMVKTTIEKVMRVKLDMEAYYGKLENEALANFESPVIWTRAMRRLGVLVYSCLRYNEPVLLVGETGCGKTTICQVLATYLKKELTIVNCHENTETGDILGSQRPIRNRLEIQGELVRMLMSIFDTLKINVPIEKSTLSELLKIYDSIESCDGIDSNILKEVNEKRSVVSSLFSWYDGPLVLSMKTGNFFLLDEISLADDSVLERLNSVLEPERTLLLAEKGVDDVHICARDGFQFLATMNPGGDYGKKELSPALRNRFTEIWVPSMDDMEDIRHIISIKLNNSYMCLVDVILYFSEWFGKKFGGGQIDNGVISLRDILSWVEFINALVGDIGPSRAVTHGALMVFIDAIGTNNTSYLADDRESLKQIKLECLEKLSSLMNEDILYIYDERYEVTSDGEVLKCGPFSIPRKFSPKGYNSINLRAPTTAKNTMRVLRAMHVGKPILLEGSPGVGKTSLVSSLASSTGNKLVRINLSEQTDLLDLFGSESPSEDGKTGEFTWRDGPFLRAMKEGEWVLLDEMNLASQSVLEGLNATLDHRGVVYIPELDKSFPRNEGFTVFAAQNPQYQGGARKGLPKSFVNRFTVVYNDTLETEDMSIICHSLYPNIQENITSKLIFYMDRLNEEVCIKKMWGYVGSPWEFNLRDILRWLEFLNTDCISNVKRPEEFLNMIVCQRFRTEADRNQARMLFESTFERKWKRDNYYNIGERYIQVGNAIMRRGRKQQSSRSLLPLQCNFEIIESVLHGINHNIPLIITGPSNAGKSSMIKFVASIVGSELEEFAMNSDVDSMDILGGYEQVDHVRDIKSLLTETRGILVDILVKMFDNEHFKELIFSKALILLHYVTSEEIDISKFEDFCNILELSLGFIADDRLLECQQISVNILKNMKESLVLNFRWFDGILVKAVEQGKWLILDNANLCSSSVVDRLNSLLEPNGSLVINECTSKDGVPKVLKPHPNFRIFITLNPKYGELSRAMRNRAIEIFMDSLDNRVTKFDRKMLGIHEHNEDGKCLTEKKPMLSFLSPGHSYFRPLAIIEDALELMVRGDTKACAHAFAGVLSVWNVWEMENWTSTDCFLNEKLYPVVSWIKSRIPFLTDTKVLAQVQNIYSPLSHRAELLTNANVDYCQWQSLNPLVNQDALPLSSGFLPSEWHYFYAVFFGLFDMQQALRDMNFKALNGRANELNYIEKSMATFSGRNIKKSAKPTAYFFVSGVYRFINDTMQYALSNNIIGHGLLYEGLFELSVIWSSIIFTSMEIDESKLRIFKDLVQAWLDKHGSKPTIKVFGHDLANSINSFAESVSLETGNAMEMIWMQFRNTYPSSGIEWAMVKELINISDNFDKIASRQFPDVQHSLIQLRKYILHLYEDVVRGTVTEDEWHLVSESLRSKLLELDQLSDSFLCKRRNLFQYEFHLVSNFITNSKWERNDVDELKVANLSNKKTILRLQTPNDDIFNPYPMILDYLWTSLQDDNKYVAGLFSSELVSSSIYKCCTFISCPGRELEQNVDDLRYFGTALVLSSEAILNNQKEKYAEILIQWIIKLLDILKLNDQGHTAFSEIKNNPGQVTVELVEKLKIIICNLQDEAVSAKVKQLFLSSVRSLQEAKDLKDLGKSWMFFSTAALQLYVPSSPYDPAIREHINYTLYEETNDYIEQLSETWKLLREVFSGDLETLLEKTTPKMESRNAPKRPRVYRPGTSVDSLFEEWKYFLDSTVGYGSLMYLVNSIEKSNLTALQQVSMLRNSASQFFDGMRTKYMYYCDINDILFGFVSGIMFGLELMLVQVKDENVKFNLGALDLVKISKIMSPLDIYNMTGSVRSFCKDIPLSSVLPEQLILFIVSLCFNQKNLKHDNRITEALNGSLEVLYLRWKARCVEEENNFIRNSSLYKHADQDEDLKADFEKLFPDYDNILNIDGNIEGDGGANNSFFESLFIKLADLYIDAYLNGNMDSIALLVLKGSKTLGLLYNYTSELKSEKTSPELMTALVNVISSSLENVDASNKEIDFYRGHSTGDSKRATSVVLSICLRVKKLLQQWPENILLVNIYTASSEFLGYPVKVSIGKMLQKVEQIHMLVAEWEKYAHHEVSLKHDYDRLTLLIVTWRKLELNTWNSLLKNEEMDSTKDIGKWWFHLFETIVIPVVTRETTQSDIELIHALNLFLSQSNIGGYEKKLNLLKAFRNDIENFDSLCSAFGILSNVLSFFDQFTPSIRERVINSKKDLEKEIHDVILLASWKDVNIEALRQSSRRSHNSLYKVVRKYRSLLASSVFPIIQSGLLSDTRPNYKYKELATAKSINIDFDLLKPYCELVESWKNRSSLIRTLDVPNIKMTQYVRDIRARNIPDVYQMAKTLLSESDRLRNETPKILNKDNKKKVAALKNEKRKLLSDTLKEARRIGLKTTTRSDVKKTLETVNVILVHSKPLCGPYTESLDAYFFRTLEILPRLKTNIINALEDAPRQDLERCFSVIENLLILLIRNREIVLGFSCNFLELEKGYSMLVKVSKLFLGKEKLLDRKMRHSFLLTSKNFDEFMVNFPIILDYVIYTLRNTEQFTGAIDMGSYYKIKLWFSELENEYKECDQTVTTSNYSCYFRHLCGFYEATVRELLEWKLHHKKQSFLADIVLDWLDERSHIKELRIENNVFDHSSINVENVEYDLRNLSILTMVVTQELTQMSSAFSEEDDDWFTKTEVYIKKVLRLMNPHKVLRQLWKCINSIVNIERAAEYSDVVSSLVSFTLPWICQYFTLFRDVFEKVRDNYERNCHSTYIYASCLSNLSSQGFCTPNPPSEETADDNLQEGTGLGEGEGENINEENIDAEEDLTENAKDSEKQDENENEVDNDDDDALEAENDLEGAMEDATGSEDEPDENDMDEEVDDNDEIDTNTIDEKMWGEESQESSKEKDSKEMPENSAQGDTEAKEEEEGEDKNDQNQKGATNEDTEDDKEKLENDEGEEEENDDGDEEEKDFGEQEDAVHDEDNEQVDENIADTEALELPENMNLDSDKEQGSQELSDEVLEDDDLNDKTNLDDGQKMDQEDPGNEEEDENIENHEASKNEHEEDLQDKGEREEPEEPEETEEPDLQQKSDEGLNEEDFDKKEEPLSKEEQPLDASTAAQSDAGADESSKENKGAEAAAADSGEMNEDAETFEKQESSGSGVENLNKDECENTEREHNNVEDARDAIKESLKQLGDSLKDFYRNREDIKENMGDHTEEDQNKKVEKPEEFEHISAENNDFDTQALGSADKEQIMPMDEDDLHGQPDEPEDQGTNEINLEKEYEDENKNKLDIGEADPNKNYDNEHETDIGDKIRTNHDQEKPQDYKGMSTDESDKEEEMDGNTFDYEHGSQDLVPIEMNEARSRWRKSELSALDLASGLCEQLKLILEPTVATKLTGDYKTGKRLNLKRIIPYIASDFKKDKIWMRRTKPSRRDYQIMIAIDDSKSMNESKCSELALNSIALVSKALSQLESGGLSIVGFGELVRLLHPFEKPFSCQESGPKVFQWLEFQQTKTDIRRLCEESIKIFNRAKVNANNDLWQLEIVLSDGVCEDHETIRKLVRKARNERIMLVFVIIDKINSNESILDMSQASYEFDTRTGGMNLNVQKYLDTFPFEFYVVVRDINELPNMLCSILRQYFSEIAST